MNERYNRPGRRSFRVCLSCGAIGLLLVQAALEFGNSSITLAATILANSPFQENSNSSGTAQITSLGYNLSTASGGGYLAAAGDQINVTNPLLAPLGNYGGPTQMMALLPGSPVIGAGSNALIPSGLIYDQRGVDSPRIGNGTVDIGAFESSGFKITVLSGSGQSANLGAAFGAALVVKVTANNPLEPVNGGTITFNAPSSGPSATLGSVTASISNGQASVSVTANNMAGAYIVEALCSGETIPPGNASFALTNISPVRTAPIVRPR